MPSPFSPQHIFRHVPVNLLRSYFVDDNIPLAVDWDELEDGDVDAIHDAWLKLKSADRGKAEVAFHAVHGLATPAGVKVIIEECDAHRRQLGEQFMDLETHHAMAMWCRTRQKDIFDVAVRFYQADELSEASWKRVGGLPRKKRT